MLPLKKTGVNLLGGDSEDVNGNKIIGNFIKKKKACATICGDKLSTYYSLPSIIA